jgi:murein DD-endopeptidase MepM/ murein hydrolase activator NlpD|tara:strand:+ start:24053 stop:24844 length:792 start_codon:yes stop_codon:yes gene_type:complete
LTKKEKYTVMIIPDDETGTRSYHVSKNIIFLIFSSFIGLVFLILGVLIYFIPKIENYKQLQNRHDQFATERLNVLELTRNLERIKQMDEMVRISLGRTLDLSEQSIPTDSIKKSPSRSRTQISFIENIPSIAPIQGFLSQRSGSPGLFITKAHHGIDIVAKEGEPIIASASGVVVFSSWTYEFGNLIILYHGDDYFTHYGHNKQNLKQTLDIIERGEVIGLVGNTGVSSGPHLHFEVWREFEAVDPLIYFPEYRSKDLTSFNE